MVYKLRKLLNEKLNLFGFYELKTIIKLDFSYLFNTL